MSKAFDDKGLYCTTDQALRVIAARGTLAIWRHKGCGPRYYKFGNRVIYRGGDLNEWVEQHMVEPTLSREPQTDAA